MPSLEDRLRAVPFFRALSPADVQAIGATLEAKNLRKGTIVFREGEIADAMYLVDSGQLEVLRGGDATPVALLGAGSVAGELALLLGEPRSATVRASTPCRLWRLGRAELDRLLADHPALALELSAELGRRLVLTTRRLTAEGVTRVTTVVEADAGALAAAIAAEGGSVGVLPVRRAAVPPSVIALDPAGYTGDRLAQLAGQRIEGLDQLVVVVPKAATPLGRIAIDMSEWVVAAARPPDWITRRQPLERIARVDVTDPGALRSVARLVSGRAIGIALSSGGSKTVAHVGVLGELQAQGVTLDAVSGASGGALVGTALAIGATQETMVSWVRELARYLRVRKWDLHVVPRSGLMRGRRLHNLFDKFFDGRNIEDLPIPLYVIASDVTTGEEVVFDKGPISDAVRASMSIPAALDPWRIGRRVYIDGGVTNPLPAGPLRRAGYERVIASNVAGKDVDPAARPGERLPSMVSVILRTINLMEAEVIKAQLSLADVVIRPHVRATSSFDFTDVDGFVAAGAEAVRHQATALADLG